jgi:hypothetical protein
VVEAAAPAPAPSGGNTAGKALGIAGRIAGRLMGGGYTKEGIPIGFGVGKSPPRAAKGEACCYCPIYNATTGDVLAWVPNPPKYPRRAAAAYARMAESIEQRHKHIEEVLGRTIDTYHRAEQVVPSSPCPSIPLTLLPHTAFPSHSP